MKLFRNTTLLFLLVGLLFSLSGCKIAGTDKDRSPSPSSPVAQMTNIAVYYPKTTDTDTYLVREVHKLKKTSDMPKTAVEELIHGKPVTTGAYRVLPSSTKVLSITIDDQGIATVDFSAEVLQANVGSGEEAIGIASIINTLTEFENIKKVSLMVDGSAEKAMDWWGHVGLSEQPFSRNISVVNEPAIWVNSPAPDQIISSPLEITGTAQVFEAQVNYRLKDSSGNILAEGYALASEGPPGRGDFKTQIDFDSEGPGKGQIEVFWISMKDGTEDYKVIIPVSLGD